MAAAARSGCATAIRQCGCRHTRCRTDAPGLSPGTWDKAGRNAPGRHDPGDGGSVPASKQSTARPAEAAPVVQPERQPAGTARGDAPSIEQAAPGCQMAHPVQDARDASEVTEWRQVPCDLGRGRANHQPALDAHERRYSDGAGEDQCSTSTAQGRRHGRRGKGKAGPRARARGDRGSVGSKL